MVQTHLEIVQGTPFRFLVKLKRKNDEDEVVPFELPGCSVRLQARAKVSDSATLLDLSSDGEEITIDEDEGTFLISLTSAQTRALSWIQPHAKVRAVFQCEVTQADGEDLRVLEGTLTLNPEVVR